MLFIWSKNFFRSQDIRIFVFPSSSLFPPVSSRFRRWSNIYLKVCDVINWLSMKEDYQKTFKKINLIFSFAPSPSLWGRLWKVKGAWNWLQNRFRKIPILVMYHLRNFDDLIQGGVWLFPKITFANFWKPIHNIIIIPISCYTLNLETVKRKGENYKKWNIWRMKRAF